MIVEGFNFQKTLKQISIRQKKQFRERIKSKLQINGTRFETDDQESVIIYKSNFSKDQDSQSKQVFKLNGSKDQFQLKSGVTSIQNFDEIQLQNNPKFGNIIIDQSSNDGPGDKNYSIASSSVQSGVPRSIGKFSKYAAEGAAQRAKRAKEITGEAKDQEKNKKRRVQIVNDEKSTPNTPHSGTPPASSGREINLQNQNLEDNDNQNVPYIKKKSIKRFSTLKDRQHNSEQRQQRRPDGGSSDSSGKLYKKKIKRGQTQKAESRAYPAEGSDNGMTLCKISESCLEQLSIVESDELYGSESPNLKQREYDERIERRIREGNAYKDEVKRAGANQTPQMGGTGINAPKTKNVSAENASDKDPRQTHNVSPYSQKLQHPALAKKPANPPPLLGLQGPRRMLSNTKQKVIYKNIDDNQYKKKGTLISDFVSLGSSSEFGAGRQSHFSKYYVKSRDKLSYNARPLAMAGKRDSSSYMGSNLSSKSGHQSAHFSIGKSRRSHIRKNQAFTQCAAEADGNRRTAGSNVRVNNGDRKSTPSKKASALENSSIQTDSEFGSAYAAESPGIINRKDNPPSPALVPNVRQKELKAKTYLNINAADKSRGRSLGPPKKKISNLAMFKRNNPRSQVKKKVLSKELAQVIEKEEHDYSPMKSALTNVNFDEGVNLRASQDKIAIRHTKDDESQALDNELRNNQDSYRASKGKRDVASNGGNPQNGSESVVKKQVSTEEADSHQFEDSLLEQSSPLLEKAGGGRLDQGSHDAVNIQLCNASGSYRVQKITISSSDYRNGTQPKPRVARNVRRSPHKAGWPKDQNHANIRHQQLFIPNQESVSHVLGKSRMYLDQAAAAADRQRLNSHQLQSSRKSNTHLQPRLSQNDETSVRNRICTSLASGTQADNALERQLAKQGAPQLQAGHLPPQPLKTNDSMASLNSADISLHKSPRRRKPSPKFQRMQTQKANAKGGDHYTPAEVPPPFRKQKTQQEAKQGRETGAYGAVQPQPKAHEKTVNQYSLNNQIMFAQRATLNKTTYEKFFVNKAVRHDLSRSQLRPRQASNSNGRKNLQVPTQQKLKKGSRTTEKWKPGVAKWVPGTALDVVVDGDLGMIIPGSYGSRGYGGFEKDSTRVISPEAGSKFYDQMDPSQAKTVSSVNSQIINRKSLDTLGSKRQPRRNIVVTAAAAGAGNASTSHHQQHFNSPPYSNGPRRVAHDLPLVNKTKNKLQAPSRQTKTQKPGAVSEFMPGQPGSPAMPSIKPEKAGGQVTSPGRLQGLRKTGLGAKSGVAFGQRQQTQAHGNPEILDIIKGLYSEQARSNQNQSLLHTSSKENTQASDPHRSSVMYYNDLFAHEPPAPAGRPGGSTNMPRIENTKAAVLNNYGAPARVGAPGTRGSADKEARGQGIGSRPAGAPANAVFVEDMAGRGPDLRRQGEKFVPLGQSRGASRQAHGNLARQSKGSSSTHKKLEPYSVAVQYFRPGPTAMGSGQGARKPDYLQSITASKQIQKQNFNLKLVSINKPRGKANGGGVFQGQKLFVDDKRAQSWIPILEPRSKVNASIDLTQPNSALNKHFPHSNGNMMSGPLIPDSANGTARRHLHNNTQTTTKNYSKKKRLQPLDAGRERDPGFTSQFQQMIMNHQRERRMTRTGGGEHHFSISPSASRNSKKVNNLNQSIDQYYFGPEINTMLNTSSAALVKHASPEVCREGRNGPQRRELPSQVTMNADGHSLIQRGPLQPPGRATIFQNRIDQHELAKQQQMSLYLQHSQRSRTSHQRRKALPDGAAKGMAQQTPMGLAAESEPNILAINSIGNQNPASPGGSPRDATLSPNGHQNPVLSDQQATDYGNAPNQNAGATQMQYLQQQLRTMNLNGLKYEMLTTNRSWRSGLGRHQQKYQR